MAPYSGPPEIEKGYCNPPDSPAVLAATPEEAARVQGIEAPKEPEPDALDAMTRIQLVEECNRLGVEVPKGARETRLRKDIRAKLAELAAKGEARMRVLAEADPTPPEVLTQVREELIGIYSEHGVGVGTADEAVKLELPTEPVARQEALDAIAEESRRGGHVFVEMSQEDAQATLDVFNKIEAAQAAEKDAALGNRDFVLYINCMPVKDHYLGQAELVRKGNELIKRESGHEAFQLVEYGKGPAYLALAVKSAIDDGSFGVFCAIVLDTRTAEGQALVTTLEGMAVGVVRAF